MTSRIGGCRGRCCRAEQVRLARRRARVCRTARKSKKKLKHKHEVINCPSRPPTHHDSALRQLLEDLGDVDAEEDGQLRSALVGIRRRDDARVNSFAADVVCRGKTLYSAIDRWIFIRIPFANFWNHRSSCWSRLKNSRARETRGTP